MITPNYLRVAGNDEHGQNPPTPGKRTPVMPYINRPFYENEFNRPTKYYFLRACARCGFYVSDIHPVLFDTPLPDRVDTANSLRPAALATFAYNATRVADRFSDTGGTLTFFSSLSPSAFASQRLAARVSNAVAQLGVTQNLGYSDLDIAILSSVNAPSVLVEAGFMTNFYEAKLMIDPEWQTMVAEATAIGVCRFLDIRYNPSSVGADYPNLQNGSSGNYVYFLQSALLCQGYGTLSLDGRFGGLTERAVKNFQQDNGLPADGVVGTATWATLLTDFTTAPVLTVGSSGVYVRYLKAKLLSKLYQIDQITNVFDQNTAAAVRSFQSEHGLLPDGVVGAATWRAVTTFNQGRSI